MILNEVRSVGYKIHSHSHKLLVAQNNNIMTDKKCSNCGNNDQTNFIMDAKNGDIICKNCGAVVIESLMHEGSQFRKFEGAF
jgi:ribosomal protein S27E